MGFKVKMCPNFVVLTRKFQFSRQKIVQILVLKSNLFSFGVNMNCPKKNQCDAMLLYRLEHWMTTKQSIEMNNNKW